MAPAQPEAPPKAELPLLEVLDPAQGWKTRDMADWQARRLREHRGVSAFNYVVLPTPYGRWGFVLYLRSDPQCREDFLTSAQVDEHL